MRREVTGPLEAGPQRQRHQHWSLQQRSAVINPAGLAAVSPPSSTNLPITERGARTGRLLVICSEGLNEGVDVVHSTCDLSIAQPLASPMVIPKVNFLAIGVGKRDYRDLTTVVRATETPVDG